MRGLQQVRHGGRQLRQVAAHFAVAALLTQPALVRGIVTDPDARAVALARVDVVCGTATATVATDVRGGFALPPPADGECTVLVRHAGFADRTLTWSPEELAPLRVRLALSPRRETVDVRASTPAPARAATTSASSIELSPDRLRALGPDLNRWLTWAERAAGHPVGARAVDVNGLTTSAVPATDTVTSVRVANDPFSAETGGTDRFVIAIDAEPSRAWSGSVSPGLIMTGQRDVLLPSASHRSQTRGAAVSGPLLPSARLRALTSWTQSRSNDVPAYLDPLTRALTRSIGSTTASDAGSLGMAGWFGPLAIQSSVTDGDTTVLNGGVGGTAGPAESLSISTRTRGFDTSLRIATNRWQLRGGVSLTARRQHANANATGEGRRFLNQVLSGAPDIVNIAERSTSLQTRVVMESPAETPARWLVGAALDRSTTHAARVFNAAGMLQLASLDASDGARIQRLGEITVVQRDAVAALFGQRTVVSSASTFVRIGARLDWQRARGLSVSPRLSFGTMTGGFLFGANAGTFAEPWSSSADMERLFTAASPPITVTSGDREWTSTIAGVPRRRHDVVARLSVLRPFNGGTLMIEETATIGRHLTGLRRSIVGSQLVDTLDTTRSLSRWRTHIRADVSLNTWSASAHYEFTVARDNTDGPFSLPARQSDLDAEWGPSSSMPVHRGSVVLSGAAPHHIQLLIAAQAASGQPYSLVTGLDPDGLFTFTGRVGASRNLARLPASSDVSAYASRSFPLRVGRLTVDAGVRAENLLGRIVALDVDRLSSSRQAGQPISAARGRTISVWATIAR